MGSERGFDEVIAAIAIFRKYGNPSSPFHCEHDVLYVTIEPEKVSEEDKAALDRLGFHPSSEQPECFQSFRYGSA